MNLRDFLTHDSLPTKAAFIGLSRTRDSGTGRLVIIAALLMLFTPFGSGARGENEEASEINDPAEILAWVRYSNAAQDNDLFGTLRNARGERVRFRLTMKNSYLRFTFDEPLQIIQLNIEDSSYLLREVVNGSTVEIPSARYAEPIRGSDILYEDLAMRFLYWPNPTLEGEQRVKTRKCWKLRIYNPIKLGPYHCVEIWVDQGSGGIMRMQCYDYDGKMIKRCSVNSGHKLSSGVWVLKEMRVESYHPGENTPYARSYLEIDKP